jgi:hypothetical protein
MRPSCKSVQVLIRRRALSSLAVAGCASMLSLSEQHARVTPRLVSVFFLTGGSDRQVHQGTVHPTSKQR